MPTYAPGGRWTVKPPPRSIGDRFIAPLVNLTRPGGEGKPVPPEYQGPAAPAVNPDLTYGQTVAAPPATGGGNRTMLVVLLVAAGVGFYFWRKGRS